MNLFQFGSLVTIAIILNFVWDAIYAGKRRSQSHSQQKSDSKDRNIRSREIRVFLTIVLTIPVIGGIWATNYWFGEYNLAKESITWKTYPGRILSKQISYFKPAGQTGTQVSGKTYVPDVKYEFEYKGKMYQWSVIDLRNAPASGDQRKSQMVLDMLPEVGEPVDVYFSPEKGMAVLIPGAENSNYFGLIIGVAFLAVGLFGLKFTYG